ncbi:MAG TPA: elongation factor P maturation arginine rhamnosyltransferase EarP [Thermoflexales bacterium]|nr:elongation factor P maturation arginine rhamnosyltransferase EarP [Thermoflexales bacterium]HQW34800.1 elongation factor P maturation arginine rhamnosyltransferase EarP [Thermoflexales bacterium]
MHFPLFTWHIYCHIVDNFGDVGILWRLARQLANEYDQNVHLWVDNWDVARALIRELPEEPQIVEFETEDGGRRTAEKGPSPIGLRLFVGPWSALADGSDCTGDVLIEGFGCELPAITQTQVKTRVSTGAPKPLWINLEYFTAEKWVEGFHLRSGFDPPTGWRRWFFFPSFPGRCGGLIRERSISARSGLPNLLGRTPGADLRILCFAYANAPYAAWLNGLREASAQPIHLLLCGEYTQKAVILAKAGIHNAPNKEPAKARKEMVIDSRPRRNDIELMAGMTAETVPFLSQPNFDDLLRSANMLWVRGEDSLARALWSGRPFIWQLYPQEENAHHAKLEAWLENYAAPFSVELREALADVHRAWNGAADADSIKPALQKLMAFWPEWQAAARARSDELAKLPDLAENLLRFVNKSDRSERSDP